MADLTDSEILGRSEADWDLKQEDLDRESLLYHDQRELLEKVGDKDLSKYELRFLLDQIKESDRLYWTKLFSEIIRVFSLNTLTSFILRDVSLSRIKEINSLLIFLKETIPEAIIIDNKIPREREPLIEFVKNLNGNQFLIFALETMDNDDINRFIKYFTN